MFAYVLRRLLLMIPTTLGVALVIFCIFHAAPGDPATVMIGMASGGEMEGDADIEARIAAFERKYGLDRSLPVQFLNYIGPFNLLRDGHPWFSSPYTEREVFDVQLEDGSHVREGEPMHIDYLPRTSEEVRAELDAAAAALVDDSAGEAAWARAEERLAASGEEALPGLLSQLFELRGSTETRVGTIGRLSAAAVRITGHTLPTRFEGDSARIMGHWFAWYFENGGRRVRNTGERPWGGLLALDLGKEMQRKTPVAPELWRRLKVTVPLALASVFLTYLIALPLGIFSARRQGTKVDGMVSVGLFVLYSIPQFWAGLMLILLFGVTGPDWAWWPKLPVLGLMDKDHELMTRGQQIKDVLLHCILPVATMTYGAFTYLSRQMRAGMLDVIRQDYIRTARAKGLSERVVIYKHALRNSVIPVITLFASILPILVGGSIIVEAVFDLPGMGKYAFEGLLRRDFYIVMATTIFVGIMTQVGILLSDIAYSLVDPRIRYD